MLIFFTALTKWVQIRTNISEAKSDKIGSLLLLLSKHLIVRGRKRRGLGEIKFYAGAIRPVPVGCADNQNGENLCKVLIYIEFKSA